MKEGLQLKPLYDRVVIQPDEERTTKSGIVIPDTIKGEKTPQIGIVVAKGPGKMDEKGNTLPMHVNIGDKVIFGKYSGDDVEVEGLKYKILHEDSIFAIITN